MGEISALTEVMDYRRRPALADFDVLREGIVERAEVVGEGAVVDTKGFGGGDGNVEHGPLVLQGLAVGGAFRQEIVYLCAFASDTEGSDASLLNLVLKEVQETVVLKVVGFNLMEEPGVDVVGAEGGEAALERGPGLEEEAGAFDSSEAEDEPVGAKDRLDAGEGTATQAAHRLVFKDRFDGIGVEPNGETGIVFKALAMEAGKIGFGAPAGDVGVEVGEGWYCEADLLPDGVVLTSYSGEASELEGSLVVASEFGFVEGPAAGFDAGARLKSMGSNSRIWPPHLVVVPPLARKRPV